MRLVLVFENFVVFLVALLLSGDHKRDFTRVGGWKKVNRPKSVLGIDIEGGLQFRLLDPNHLVFETFAHEGDSLAWSAAFATRLAPLLEGTAVYSFLIKTIGVISPALPCGFGFRASTTSL